MNDLLQALLSLNGQVMAPTPGAVRPTPPNPAQLPPGTIPAVTPAPQGTLNPVRPAMSLEEILFGQVKQNGK